MQALPRYVTCVSIQFHLGLLEWKCVSLSRISDTHRTVGHMTCLQYPFCGKSEVLSAAAALSAFN